MKALDLKRHLGDSRDTFFIAALAVFAMISSDWEMEYEISMQKWSRQY